MASFERLKAKASTEWRAYTEHPFTNGLADGTLAGGTTSEASFMGSWEAKSNHRSAPSERYAMSDWRSARRLVAAPSRTWSIA